jgi:hypothetical protein
MNNIYVSRNEDAAYRIIDHEALIVVPGNNTLYVLNRVGARIWEVAIGKVRMEDLAETICGEFNVTYDLALSDINQFVNELSLKGLLEIKS